MQLLTRISFAAVLVAFSAPALAQQAPQPDPVQDIAQDWQAAQIAQSHVLRSMQALVNELQAARARIKELEAQQPKKDAGTQPPKK